jgi:integrase
MSVSTGAMKESINRKPVTKMTKRRKKGTGSLFRRGNVWWYALTVRGATERKSTDCTNRDDAATALRERIKEVKCQGVKRALVRPTKITVKTLITTLRSKYENDGKASADTIGGYVKAWEASSLWHRDANELRYDDFDRQAREWQTQPWQAMEKGAKRIVSNATINRRMALLSAAYRFGRKKLGLTVLPEFPHLPEKGRLTDKFSQAEIETICANLPQDYADVFRFACATGVRKGQLLNTTWRMVDAEGWSITWPQEVCKKQKPHTIHLDDDALEIIQRRHAQRRLDQRLVFHRDGKVIGNMSKTLKKAFAAAGIPYGRRVGKVFHGTRRTAVTNLVESGVARSIAKTISGHSTDDMFARYAIHDEAQVQQDAQRKAGEYRRQRPTRAKVVSLKKDGAS